MDSRFREACGQILSLKDHRDALVRKTVTWLLPALAEYEPQVFVGEYLNTCMVLLMSQLKTEKDQSPGELNRARPKASTLITFVGPQHTAR